MPVHKAISVFEPFQITFMTFLSSLRAGCAVSEQGAVLTVITLGASVGGHGAVTVVVLPQLDTNAHIGTGIFLTGGAGTCENTQPQQTHTHTHI